MLINLCGCKGSAFWGNTQEKNENSKLKMKNLREKHKNNHFCSFFGQKHKRHNLGTNGTT